VLRHFDGRIAAELRLWDAIDQEYLPFAYFGIHDGLDLRSVPWRRGQGYDVAALEGILTADHAWVHLVFEEVRRKITDPSEMRALGYCVSVGHAHFMAQRFTDLGLPAVALSAASHRDERARALRDLSAGRLRAVFTVDLFNEGIDIPSVDTLLLLRPTDSPTLFLQQLGRGLRKTKGKGACTVLDFVGTHRKEFRFDRRLRALLGGSRAEIERQIRHDFPFLPAGCSFHLDEVAREVVLQNIREAIPSTWRERCNELRTLGDIGLSEYLDSTASNWKTSTPVAAAGQKCIVRWATQPTMRAQQRSPYCARVAGCCTSMTMSGWRPTRASFAKTALRRLNVCHFENSDSSACSFHRLRALALPRASLTPFCRSGITRRFESS
jgi:superfamily II DNA or RNA helicase